MNRATICGRLGQKPEIRYTKSGTAVCNFSIATTERFTKNDQKVEETEWHGCVCWGNVAEFLTKYAMPGDVILVSGKLKTSKWEKDGQKFQRTEIISDSLERFPKAPKTNQDSESDGQPSHDDDGIAF